MEGMWNNDLVECRLDMLTMIKCVHSSPEIPLSDREKLDKPSSIGLSTIVQDLSLFSTRYQIGELEKTL